MDQITVKEFKEALISASNYLEQNKERVNDLNVFPVPDGDTGTNMSKTIASAVKQVTASGTTDLSSLAGEMSRGALMGARGNSGVILSQLFRGFAEGLQGQKVINVTALAQAMKKASEMTYLAVMKPTEGTILTVGRESADFAVKHAKKYNDLILFAEAVLDCAKASLANTPNLLPVLKEAGVVDAGGQGLVFVMEGALKALKGEGILSGAEAADSQPNSTVQRHEISTDDIKFGYCTEFIVTTKSNHVEDLKKELIPRGDSLIVVGDDSMIKVHVHTNDPGLAIQSALHYGFLKDIKIDNMRLQHSERLFTDSEVKATREEENAPEKRKTYGFVSICAGEGIEKIFRDVGVDYLVTGGQTMNPSTEDILAGIEKVQAEHIFILPNNSNIFLAAEAAAEISDKDVVVLKTRSIPEGINACIHFMPDKSVEENVEMMMQAIDDMTTGQVTYAVRDTEMDGIAIKKGDFIGLSGKKILAKGQSINETTIQTIEKMVDEDATFISLYAGEDVSEEDAEAMISALEDAFPDIDIEIMRGEQPIYYYLISVE
ncbi:MAG: DAK2 domain-containing protein [Peptoniphilus sp.]|nr:DAK2 domain-containing protein [Peptoniphilus sp.]MDY3119290.1 DAK2 domain-containing protein [Peptoniphilus sp.]